MKRDEDHIAPVEPGVLGLPVGAVFALVADRGEQCIDDGVACDANLMRRNAFATQILRGLRRRRAVQRRRNARRAAIELFRPGCRQVARSQPRFDMD